MRQGLSLLPESNTGPNPASCSPSGFFLLSRALPSPTGPKVLGCWDLTSPDHGKQLTSKSRLVGAKPAIYSLFIDKVAHACPIRRESDKRVYSPETFTHNVFNVCLVPVCLPMGTGKRFGDSRLFFLLPLVFKFPQFF